MISSLFDSTAVEQAVSFSQARHNVLAGNIANLDTPGYQVRDLSVEAFQTNLKQAIENNDCRGASGSEDPAAEAHDLASVRETMSSLIYPDKNISLEQQVAEISKNQMQHNLALALLTSQFHTMLAAISERA